LFYVTKISKSAGVRKTFAALALEHLDLKPNIKTDSFIENEKETIDSFSAEEAKIKALINK